MSDPVEILMRTIPTATSSFVEVEPVIRGTERRLSREELSLLETSEENLGLAEAALKDCRSRLSRSDFERARAHVQNLRRRFDAAKATYRDRLGGEES